MKKPDPRTCFLKGLYLARAQADINALETLVKSPAPLPLVKLLGKVDQALAFTEMAKDKASRNAVSSVRRAIIRRKAKDAVKEILLAKRRIYIQIDKAERSCL